MIKKTITAIICCAFLISCGSTRKTTKIATKDAEAANIIARHYNTAVDFKTLSGRLRAAYQTEDKSQSVNLSFKIEKDKNIWLSAQILGFPVAKALITPTKVQYYEKMGKTYFDGDFSLLSKWLGTPLDFQKLQNLLIGQAIYDLREESYDFRQSPRGFQLIPSEETSDIEKMFVLDTENYKALAQQLMQHSENRNVIVTYNDYQQIKGKTFPTGLKIIANDGGKSTNIDLDYRSLSLNEDINFYFEIPSGYEEIDGE